MRWLLAVYVAVALFDTGAAHADDRKKADQLHREGRALAKAKRYTEAIAKFKAGQKLHFSWRRTCNIGLAYDLSGRPYQAELFLHRCKQKAGAEFSPAMQSWLDKVHAKLSAGGFARVTITTEPKNATIAVDAFAADETVASGEPFWLPLGSQRITVSGTKMLPRVLVVKLTEATPVVRHVELKPVPPPATHEPNPAKPKPVATATPIKLPPSQPTDTATRGGAGIATWALIGGGLLSLGAGAVFHVYALRTSDRAEALPPRPADQPYPEYDSELKTFERQRLAAIGLYAVGAVATAVGIYSWTRSHHKHTRSTIIGAIPTRSGGTVFARWSF